jgi:hypothetical protein
MRKALIELDRETAQKLLLLVDLALALCLSGVAVGLLELISG